jgi:hypothetical protein
MKNIILKNWINPDSLLFVQKEGIPYYDKTTNEWKQQKGFKSTSPTVRQKGISHPHFKRVAYSKNTPYYNHIVIDADSGAAKITAQCKTLFTLCGISPLYITGTDNPDKPADSASVLIFFKPLEKTPASKTLLTNTIRLFNLYSGGDLRNVGYQHKNPWLDYISVTWPNGEPQKENLPTLEYIYTQSCKYWNIPPQQVNDIYRQKVKISYDESLQNLIASVPNPSPQKVKAYWYASSRLPQLHEKIQPYLNLRPLHEWIIIYRLCKFYLNPQYFPQRFPFCGEYFDNFTSTDWIENQVWKQHSISAGEFQQQAENLKIAGTLVLSAGLLADDVSGIGVADDVVIPPVLVFGSIVAGTVWLYDKITKTNGKNERHGDGGRAKSKAEQQIEDLEQ